MHNKYSFKNHTFDELKCVGFVKTNNISLNLRGLLVATKEFHYPPGSILRSTPRY